MTETNSISLPRRVKDLTGQTFGFLKATRFLEIKNRRTLWLCQCKCGKQRTASSNDLMRGYSKSCGCYRPPKTLDVAGKRFGRLIAINIFSKGARTRWLCKCDCGAETIVCLQDLRNGHTQSCGCYQKQRVIETQRLYDPSLRSEYIIWKHMIYRCTNQQDIGYKYYGAKGIAVCQEWIESFDKFVEDVGRRPNLSYTIDRIDNSLGYFPGNVRWATRKQQMRNTSRNVFLTHSGKTLCQADWASIIGLDSGGMSRRVRKWGAEAAITTPKVPRSERKSFRPRPKIL